MASEPESRLPEPPDNQARSSLTGSWGGIRDRLEADGVTFGLSYTAEVLGNLSGGIKTGLAYNGVGELSLDLDVERLTRASWPGAAVHVSSLWIHGDSPTSRLVGDSFAVSNIDGYDSIRLFEVWIEQSILEGKVSLRAGALAADEEFAGTEYGGLFLNSGFGWPVFISGNALNTGPAFFVTAPGVRVRIEATERCYLQAGIYDGDSFDSAEGDPHLTSSGTHFHLDADQGAFGIVEVGYRLNQGEDDAGLPGTYKVGAWVHTADFPDLFEDSNGESFIVSGLDPRSRDGNQGVFAAAEQLVWREASQEEPGDQGIGVFLRGGISPQDRSYFPVALDGGVAWKGALPGRGEDTLAVGFVYGRVSSEFRQQQRDDRDINGSPVGPIADHEMALEATYQAPLSPWWVIQPSFQWVHHPGTSSALPDALILGIRSSIAF